MKRLVRHAGPGRMDSKLLGSLIDRFAARLELYARQWCEEAEDVVQEAFVRLASESTTPLEPAAWLFRAVRNGAINAGIARRRRRQHEAGAAAEVPDWFESRPPSSNHIGVDPESVQAALSVLPVEQREIIVGHLWGGLTFQQLAELTGTSASSAHRLYHAGLAALRERLGVSCQTNASRSIPS
jgi:RNA polymerase sigma factor (sigma-70 family)